MPRDRSTVKKELVARVRECAGGAEEAEIRAALAPLTPAEEKFLDRLLSNPPPGHFGPFAWADLARGLDPQVAAARELSGYYTLLAERDALAALAGKPAPPEVIPARGRRAESTPSRRAPERNVPAERTNYLLGLFAYHRDAPLVARAMGVSLSDLDAELDQLGIRRKAYRLARGTDRDLRAAAPVKGASGPPVRRRTKSLATEPPPAPPPKQIDPEQALLKTALAELGPRRQALAERLGTSGGALLARFRAAGLEREFALRERDLIRALWSKHHGSESKVASELGATVEALREIAVERGIARDLAGIRDRLRRAARQKKWPGERIEQVLGHAGELRDLDVYDELLREVSVRAGVVWATLKGKRDALDLFAKKLHLTREKAQRLQNLLDLR
jgi:hypothetical protein